MAIYIFFYARECMYGNRNWGGFIIIFWAKIRHAYYSLTRSQHVNQPSQQEQRVAHERGTSASSFAIVRLHVTSGYPYASVVCMGPGYGPLSVYGRCVVLILLPRVSTSNRYSSIDTQQEFPIDTRVLYMTHNILTPTPDPVTPST